MSITIEHKRAVLAPELPVDPEVFAAPPIRLLYRMLTRRPHGATHVSRARVILSAGGTVVDRRDMSCVDEVVRFRG